MFKSSVWRAVTLFAALLLVCTADDLRAGSVADLDLENGLPDAKLGAPVQAFKGLQRTEDDGRFQSYTRPGDKLLYGRYSVTRITYNFFKDKLYSIYIDVDGKDSTRGILKLLEQQFGKVYSFDKRAYPKVESQLETREWAGTKVYMLFKCADDRAGGQLIFLDKPTWDALQIPRKQYQEEIQKKLEGSFTNGDF